MPTRRSAIISTLISGTSVLSGCWQSSIRYTGLRDAIPIRDYPAPLTYFPLKRSVLSAGDVQSLLGHVVPDWRWMKYPIGYVYHALRLWGSSVSFRTQPFINPRVRTDGWGASALGALVNEVVFAEVVSPFGRPLLVPSEFGVAVLTNTDPEWGREWASTHAGKYEQVMAELGVPSFQKLTIYGKEAFTPRDVISDSARRVDRNIECEWTTVGLACYLATDAWQNRFKQLIDFDDFAAWLLPRRLGEGACRGTHVPFAIAALGQLETHGYRRLRRQTAFAIRAKLQELVEVLTARIASDCAWPECWWQASRPRNGSIFQVWGEDFCHHVDYGTPFRMDGIVRAARAPPGAHLGESDYLAERTHSALQGIDEK